MAALQRFQCLDELRQFVQQTLCEKNHLELGAFQINEQLLRQRGNPCGLFFCLVGPRQVRLTAVWDMQSQQLLFYGSNGERQARVILQQGPRLVESLQAESQQAESQQAESQRSELPNSAGQQTETSAKREPATTAISEAIRSELAVA